MNSGGLHDIAQIAAGAAHSLAISEDGSVYSWGENQFGQLAGDVFTRKPFPITGSEFSQVLSTMRDEKNDIFDCCITDQSKALFGDIK